MVKVSVIIPVFNAENYLRRCLDSVCNQTLPDIEIICINDASTDKSYEILQEYAQNFSNLIVHNLVQNQGESAARNAGLALAQGEYLAFVDNDDAIDLNFYEKLYDKARQNNADICKGQAIEISYSGQAQEVKQLSEGANKVAFIAYWWTALYKRSLIVENKISFSCDHPLGGDLLFMNQAVIAAKDLQLVDGVYYHYYRREDSGDGKVLSTAKVKSALSIFEKIIDNVNENIDPSDSSYGFVFHHFLMGCFYISLKAEDRSTKELCVYMAMNIFQKSNDKDALQKFFAKTTPYLFDLLCKNDEELLVDTLVKCKSRMELIASGLRARIKK